MITLSRAAAAWKTPDFEAELKQEVSSLEPGQLPLQQGLCHSNYPGDGDLGVVLLDTDSEDGLIVARIGVMYTGVDAGSCCADDPTPMNEHAEYCQLTLTIDSSTGKTEVQLIDED